MKVGDSLHLFSMEFKFNDEWMILSATTIVKLRRSFEVLNPKIKFDASLIQKTKLQKRL